MAGHLSVLRLLEGGGRYELRADRGTGAEDGIRTHDPLLGKEMLYH